MFIQSGLFNIQFSILNIQSNLQRYNVGFIRIVFPKRKPPCVVEEQPSEVRMIGELDSEQVEDFQLMHLCRLPNVGH